MLFATNRSPKESEQSKIGRKITFDYQNTDPRKQMYFCERKGVNDYIEIGSKAFFKQLKSLPTEAQILFYIHGFNNTGEAEVFPNAEKLQKLMDKVGGKNLVYVVPLIWPCDDDSIASFINDYWDDQDAADDSGSAFGRMLGKFDGWRNSKENVKNPCYRRINVLAHSMGNRVLINALRHWGRHSGQVPQIFRNIFMVAADVENHVLEYGHEGELVSGAARNICVYYANDDLAMPASKVANLKNRVLSRRLGMTGVEDINEVPKNIHEVDCDNFNNTFDSPKGHTYFLDDGNGNISPVVQHMVDAIDGGRVKPDKRHHVL